MPATAAEWGVSVFDPVSSADGAGAVYAMAYGRVGSALALAAYNWGIGNAAQGNERRAKRNAGIMSPKSAARWGWYERRKTVRFLPGGAGLGACGGGRGGVVALGERMKLEDLAALGAAGLAVWAILKFSGAVGKSATASGGGWTLEDLVSQGRIGAYIPTTGKPRNRRDGRQSLQFGHWWRIPDGEGYKRAKPVQLAGPRALESGDGQV